MRALPRPAAAAASRISTTRCRRRRRKTRCATRSSGSAGSRSRRSIRSSPPPSPFFYRNKLEYSFTQTPSGPALGFHKAGRWDEVLEIEKCWLTTDLGNSIRNAVRDWAREEGLVAYDQAEHTGYLRHLVVREGRNTGQVLVMLVTAPGEKFERGYFVEVLTRFPEVKSIHWAVNDSPSEVTNLPSTLLWGEDAIEEELLGLRFRVRPNAFLQTNTEMAEKLYALAIEYAALTGGETVYDLYCGTGTIGLAMARNALTVWGVEISEESVACAIENARPEPDRQRGLLRGQRRPVDRGAAGAGGPAGRGRRRPAARRARRQGAEAHRRPRGVTDRLRLLQPDDARVRREGAARTSTATSSPARGRSTCSRTRRTSRRSRCSRAPEHRSPSSSHAAEASCRQTVDASNSLLLRRRPSARSRRAGRCARPGPAAPCLPSTGPPSRRRRRRRAGPPRELPAPRPAA